MDRKKLSGVLIFGILLAAAVFAAVRSGGRTGAGERGAFRTVGLAEGAGYTVSGQNPVTVRAGEDASFRIILEEGYYLTDPDGCLYEDGLLTLKNVGESRTLTPTVVTEERLPKVSCSWEGRGEIRITDERDRYFFGETVTFAVRPEDHYQLKELRVNGDLCLPDPETGLLTCRISGETEVRAVFEGQLLEFHVLSASTAGSVENREIRAEYRYGDSFAAVASFDPATTVFLGWSAGKSLSEGGEAVGTDPELRGNLTESVTYYANFRLRTSFTVSYDANGGQDKGAPTAASYGRGEMVGIPADTGFMVRPGYRLIDFSLTPDGSGEHHGFGSMFLMPGKDTVLYANWLPEEEASSFRYYENNGRIVISGFSDEGKARRSARLVIPTEIEGKTVYALAENAFASCDWVEEVYLPLALENVGPFVLSRCPGLRIVDFPETMVWISGDAFLASPNFTEMRVHPSLPKVFDLYFDCALVDKYSRLKMTQDKNRIILVGGSNLAFGMDCQVLKDRFPEYEPVNLGTSAYYGMLPMLEILKKNTHEGDIIVFCPEYMTTMYAGEEDMNYINWEYIESNSDILKDLNMQNVPGVRATFTDYLKEKRDFISWNAHMYKDAAYSRASFNVYGDNVSVRPSATYVGTNDIAEHCLTERGFAKMNAFCAFEKEKGVTCLYSFGVRCKPNGLTDEEIRRKCGSFLDHMVQLTDLSVCSIISDPCDYFLETRYFYDSQYHLSNDGVPVRAGLLADDLGRWMEREGGRP